MKVWIVTPHADTSFDDWVGPAETEQDHQDAIAYAQARLEELWDQMDVGDAPMSVTIEKREVPDDSELAELAKGDG